MISSPLLEWYDVCARNLPWRVPPRALQAQSRTVVQSNPYYIWLSEIMLQQTTVATVKSYFAKFITLWPTVFDLAKSSREDVLAQWAGLGYYARARNLHSCAQIIVNEYAGQFPETQEELLKLPGIGPYTSAAIAAIAFDKHAVVIDGNVERVITRIKAIKQTVAQSKNLIRQVATALTPSERCGDYAQAMMDLGATICTPRSPVCMMCPIRAHCDAFTEGQPDTYPYKPLKKVKPVRAGTVYIIQRKTDRALLLEKRPDNGLLGGMLGFPGTDWIIQQQQSDEFDKNVLPFSGDWYIHTNRVLHQFTHFELRLRIAQIYVDEQDVPEGFKKKMVFYPVSIIKSLPTAMKKAANIALADKNLSGRYGL